MKKHLSQTLRRGAAMLLIALLVVTSLPLTAFAAEAELVSISAEPMTLIEEVDGYWDSDYDDDRDEYVDWFNYNVQDRAIFTLEYSDGTSYVGDDWDVYNKTGYDIEIETNQSYDNPWGVGNYTVTSEFMGLSFDLDITIKETPIRRFTAEDVVLYEEVDGYWDTAYNYETGDWDLEWFRYDCSETIYTVEFKTGTTVTGDYSEIRDKVENYGYYGYGFSFNDDQSYDNRWGLGEYTATAEFMGVTCDYNITIIGTTVKRITAADHTVVEGTDGYWDTDYNSETDEYDLEWYYYSDYEDDATYTVEFKDGTTFTGTGDDLYDETGYWVEAEDDQSYENQWGVGKHTATVTFMGVSCNLNVTIEETPVKRITAEDVTVIEKTGGYWIYSNYNSETGKYDKDVYIYTDHEDDVIYTVEFKDGTTLTGDYWDLEDETGYYPTVQDDQSSDHLWGVGKHTVTTYFMGASCDWNITIEETPVKGITAEDVTLIEKTDGYWNTAYNPVTHEYDLEWFNYNNYGNKTVYTVEFKDGTTFTGTRNELYDETGYWVDAEDDQSYDNQWGLGEHTVTIYFMGVSCVLNATVTETPVKGITVEGATVIEKADGNWESAYNPETDEYDLEWFRYDDYEYDATYTVEFKDGTSITGDYGDIENKTGYDLTIEDDQSYKNQWGLGEHTVTAKFMGATCDLTVTVIETPVKGITVENATVIEKADGYWNTEHNPETDKYDLEWFHYYNYEYDATYTVEFKDGTTLTGDYWDIENETGYDLTIVDNQSYENQWGLGEHTVTAKFMGATCDFTVTVVETPVKRITTEGATPIQEVDGGWNTSYNPETDEYDLEWFRYEYSRLPIYTVEFKDGTSITGDRWELAEETGYTMYIEDDQSYENQWGLGEHTATARFMGATGEVPVTVIETPVKGITAGEITLIEQGDGYWVTDYNPVTHEYDLEWFRYREYADKTVYTVEFKDGTTITGTRDEIYDETRYYIYVDDEQSYDNQWGLGKQTATAEFMGVSGDVNVIVEETPVESISARRLYPAYEDDGHLRAYNFEYTLKYKDGTTFTGDYWETVEKTGRTPSFECNADDEGAGTHTDTLHFMGVTADVTVEIVENPYTKVSIGTGEEMVITFTGENGEQAKATVKDYILWMLDDYGYSEGVLVTDMGCFYASFSFDQLDEETASFENLTLEILGLTSEKVENSAWFDNWYQDYTNEEDAIAGDMNFSGVVDVADIMKIKDLIMSGNWNDKELEVGDLNDSDILDVGDIMGIKNIIMAA